MGKALRPLLVLHGDPVLRERIRRIAPGTYTVDWLESWQDLIESMCMAQAHTLVLVDPYHGRGRQQGTAPELLRLLHGFPSATVVAALAPRPGWLRDVLTLGESGVRGVIDLSGEETTEAVRQRLGEARGRALRVLLQRGDVAPRSGRGRAILDTAVDVASAGRGVRDLAKALGLSGPTLLRWCANSRLPTPRRLLIWLRALSAAELLDDPGRSVLDVAFSCGYSSDRALRRAFRATIGIAPSELRRGGAFGVVAREFAGMLNRTAGTPPSSCPGLPVPYPGGERGPLVQAPQIYGFCGDPAP